MASSFVPSHNPLIFNQSLANTSHGPGALKQALASVTPWNEHHTSGLVSADQIQHGHVVRPTKFAPHLQAGDPLFMATIDSKREPDSFDRPETIMNLFGANDALATFYPAGMRVVEAARKDPKHFLAPYLDKPEAAWTEIYESQDPKVRENKDWVMIHYLTVDGILRRMRYLGVNIVQSLRDGKMSNRTGNYIANALHVGRGYMRNVFGNQVHANSKVYFMLGRVDSDVNTPFSWAPYVPPNYEEVIPLRDQQYRGVTGYVETSYVQIVGTCVDIMGDTPKNREILQRALGKSGNTLEVQRAGHNMLPWIEIAASNMVFQRYFY